MSSPASGCQSTPSAKRREGSSSASTVPSSALAASRRPRPAPEALVVVRLHRRVVAEQRAEPRPRVERRPRGRRTARGVLVPVVADDIREVLDEVAAERDVQHLRAAADCEHRHVPRERSLQQRELRAVALGHDPFVLDGLLPERRRIEVAPPEKITPSSASSVSSTPSSLGGTSSGAAAGAARPRARSRAGRAPASSSQSPCKAEATYVVIPTIGRIRPRLLPARCWAISRRPIAWARLAASASPSPAETIEPFIRMCHECANCSGSRSPASRASVAMIERMFSRWTALALPIGVLAIVHLEQHVDERATLEVFALEPLVEDVEDRQQLLLRRRSAARASASTQSFVQSSSRCCRNASTRSSLEAKCR